MKRLGLSIALLGVAAVQADYFEDYFAANPMPLTGTVNGAGDIDLVWPAADEICKTQIFKNGVLLDATEDFTYTDPAYTPGDTYEVLFQSCRNHVHADSSNPVDPDDPVVVQGLDCDATNATFVVNNGNPVEFGGGPYPVEVNWTLADGTQGPPPPVTGLAASVGTISFQNQSGAFPTNNYLWTVPATGVDTPVSFAYGEAAPGTQCDTGDIVILEESLVKAETKVALLANVMDTGEEDTRAGVFAFPGATGHARFSTGGRGGAACIVNTRNNVNVNGDGLRSYRECVTGINEGAYTPRTVVFDVEGEIDSGTTRVTIHGAINDNLTIACQSAPGNGIVLTGYRPMDIDNGVNDLIVRHCDIKLKDQLDAARNSGNRAVTVGGNPGTGPRRLMFDHMSLAWATDEPFSLFVNTDGGTNPPGDVTLMQSMVYEGDTTCLRPDNECGSPANSATQQPYLFPNHAMGPFMASANGIRIDGVSLIANHIANNNARNPWWRHVSGEIIRNRIVNVHSEAIAVTGITGAGNLAYIEENVIKEGPDEKQNGAAVNRLKTAAGSFVVKDNVRISQTGALLSSDYNGNNQTAVPGLAREWTTGSNEYDEACVGANRPVRDSIDARIIAEMMGDTPGTPVSAQAEVGVGPRIAPIVGPNACNAGQAFCFYEPTVNDQGQRDYSDYSPGSHPTSYDTDNDGIADAWEQMVIASDTSDNVDNLSDIDHTTDCDGDGYTDMEEFLNRLARCDI